MPGLRYRHEMKRTWDSGSPEAIDGWVTWCEGCGQRPWPCDTASLIAENRRLREGAGELIRVVGLLDVQSYDGGGARGQVYMTVEAWREHIQPPLRSLHALLSENPDAR